MTMEWKNLKYFRCPHCGEKLVEDVGKEWIRCTSCTFVIASTRCKEITIHRSYPEKTIIKMRWQNIKDDHCPVCGSNLYQNMEGKFDILKCVQATCTFKIRTDKLEEILADEMHPANVYHNRDIKKI